MEDKRRAKRERLLLIGDELYAIFLILTYLETCGYEVTSAKSNDNALEVLQATPPDLILFCEDGITTANGYTFLQQVRRNSQTAHIPVILLSSKNQTLEQAKRLDHQLDAYIVRPFDLEDLNDQINSMIWRTVSRV